MATLRYIMVGGGPSSFMGPVHRRTLAMTGLARPVGGCFSRNAAKNAALAQSLGLPPEAALPDLDALVAAIPALKPDFAVVVTPTAEHYPALMALLRAGLPVVCDKPLCSSTAQAEEVAALSRSLGLPLMVTYTYSGYAMVEEARQRVISGALGALRAVTLEYRQDWMSRRFAGAEDKSAFWRADAARGRSCCVEDIGVHAEHMIRHVCGAPLQKVQARLQSFTPGTSLDDNAFIWADLPGGAAVSIWCSQICVGRHNQLTLNVVGEKGALEWRHAEPDVLRLWQVGQPEMILRRGDPALSPQARAMCLLPLEHPEGYQEAFAALYSAFCRHLQGDASAHFPTAEDGLQSLRFIDQCLGAT